MRVEKEDFYKCDRPECEKSWQEIAKAGMVIKGFGFKDYEGRQTTFFRLCAECYSIIVLGKEDKCI